MSETPSAIGITAAMATAHLARESVSGPRPERKKSEPTLRNYFNYYTEIEEHFQRRRGSLLMLSTLDWSLIATWQEAGIPLEAVLAGIDATFEKYAARQSKGRLRRINGLAYCAQEVMRAVEDMHEAAVGASHRRTQPRQESGFEDSRIAEYLRWLAAQMVDAATPAAVQPIVMETAKKLENLAASIEVDDDNSRKSPSIEALERQITTLEDQIFAALQTFTPAEDLLALREQSARELAPYRSRLQALQIRQIEQQFLRRCLFQKYYLPRLSLFYMRQT